MKMESLGVALFEIGTDMAETLKKQGFGWKKKIMSVGDNKHIIYIEVWKLKKKIKKKWIKKN